MTTIGGGGNFLFNEVKKEVSARIVGLSYVGAFVGAGFISGQELVQFFIRFGRWGLLSWFLFVIVVIWGGSGLLGIIAYYKPESFDMLVNNYYGKRSSHLINLVFNGYLLGGLVIMLSGAGVLTAEMLKIPLHFGIVAVSLGILLTILGQGRRLLGVNKWLVPVLIILTLFVVSRLWWLERGSVSLTNKSFEIYNPSYLIRNWFLSVFLYIGYNAIGVIVALVNIGKEVSPKVAKWGGGIGGTIIAILGSAIIYTLWISYPDWKVADLPLVVVLKENIAWLYPIFAPAMFIAMFTVATAYALGLSKYLEERIKINGINFKSKCMILMILVTPVAFLGFARLLGLIYPLFGLLATVIMISLVFKFGWNWLLSRRSLPKLMSFKGSVIR